MGSHSQSLETSGRPLLAVSRVRILAHLSGQIAKSLIESSGVEVGRSRVLQRLESEMRLEP
ncbi:hypothetical protein E4U25_001092, partial [Claviceps purpurea]